MSKTLDIVIEQGKTFEWLVRWETTPIVYKAITAITAAAPARVTSTAHGIPDGWQAAVTGVHGPSVLNASAIPPEEEDFHRVSVVDANTIDFNEVSTADAPAYVSGGYLVYYTPHDMASYTARMQIKDRVGGTELQLFSTTDSTITIDDSNKTITMSVDATDTADYTWEKGVYDLELVSPGGVVTALFHGKVTVVPEVTTYP